jgi:hypothetical protein
VELSRIGRLSMTVQKYEGDWRDLRKQHPERVEIDFHRGRRPYDKPYWECMNEVGIETFDAIKDAYQRGVPYLLIGHGYSTSRPFHTSARSVVRSVLRSKKVTPFVDRKNCVQHPACFLVALKPRKVNDPGLVDAEELERGASVTGLSAVERVTGQRNVYHELGECLTARDGRRALVQTCLSTIERGQWGAKRSVS